MLGNIKMISAERRGQIEVQYYHPNGTTGQSTKIEPSLNKMKTCINRLTCEKKHRD